MTFEVLVKMRLGGGGEVFFQSPGFLCVSGLLDFGWAVTNYGFPLLIRMAELPIFVHRGRCTMEATLWC